MEPRQRDAHSPLERDLDSDARQLLHRADDRREVLLTPLAPGLLWYGPQFQGDLRQRAPWLLGAERLALSGKRCQRCWDTLPGRWVAKMEPMHRSAADRVPLLLNERGL